MAIARIRLRTVFLNIGHRPQPRVQITAKILKAPFIDGVPMDLLAILPGFGKNALAAQNPRVFDLRLQGVEVSRSESLLSAAAV